MSFQIDHSNGREPSRPGRIPHTPEPEEAADKTAPPSRRSLVTKRLASRSSGLDFGRLVERIPENAPPKWIFRDISAIRENAKRFCKCSKTRRYRRA